MIAVIKMTSGDFNVIGTRKVLGDNEFCLQGSLTLAELMELRDEAQRAIDEVASGTED